MSTKLQKLLSHWPTGAVRAVAALKREGYSQSLITRYKKSGWFTSVGDGALIKAGDAPSLIGALYALQHDLKLNVHFGAITALELQGRAHYLRVKRRKVLLFGGKKRLPKWFTDYNWKSEVHYSSSNLFHDTGDKTLTEFKESEVSILISNELRAVFECLSLVPDKFNIEEGRDIMQGLTASHPDKVSALLKTCTSIKTKRLFLVLAELAGHSWVKKLDLKGVDLGVGPRTLVSGGRMHKKYQITIPTSFFSETEK